MSATLPRIDGPADAELISAVRGGDVDAYGELFARHADAARRLARQLVTPSDADDLVSEAFAKVLTVLQRGGGPDVSFRAYLLTAVRRLHVDRIRANARVQTTDDLTPFDPGVPFQDTTVETFENEAAARAFASLPERWQLVLWHLEVEGNKPADIAPLLGMTANSVSALAYRAREGLRQAFLNEHAQEIDDDRCRWTHQHLGAYIRNGISRRDAGKVEDHLDECRKCMAIYLELSEVNSNLSGILAPLLLGGAASAYLAAAGGAATKGGLVLLLGRARDVMAAHAPATAVAGVAATAVIAGATFVTVTINSNDPQISSADQAPGAVVTPPGPGQADRGGPGDRGRARGDETGDDGVDGLLAPADPTSSSPTAPTDPASTDSSPTDSPTQDPSQTPTGSPTSSPTGSPTSSPTGSPTGSPTDSPTGSPTGSPTSSPTDSPTGSPTESPTGSPTESPTADPSDLTVRGAATPQGDKRFRVVATVSGMPSGGGGVLVVAGYGLDFLTDLGSRCALDSQYGAVCRLADAPTESFEFIAEPREGSSSGLFFTVIPFLGTPDPDLSNNHTTVVLTTGGVDRRARPFGAGTWH